MKLSRQRLLTSVLKKRGITYLVRDLFTDTLSAGSVNNSSATPGPGTRSVVDTENNISIGSNLLTFAKAKTAGSISDPLFREDLLSRKVGRSIKIDTTGLPTGTWLYLSIYASVGAETGITIYSSVIHCMYTISTALDSLVVDTPYQFRLTLRTLGLWTEVKGGAFTNWTLTHVDATNYYASSNPTQAQINLRSGTNPVSFSLFKALDLGAPYNTNFGPAVSRIQQPVANSDGISDADGIIEFTWIPTSAQVLELDVRRTDADNRWIVRCDQANSTIKLIELNAGNETERSTAAATWTVGTNYRLTVRMVGTSIKAMVDYALKNSYANATFNQTATGVYLNQDGSSNQTWKSTPTTVDFVCWPRIVATSQHLQIDLSITNLSPYQVFQRKANGKGDIPLTGTYTGLATQTTLDAQFNGGIWFTL